MNEGSEYIYYLMQSYAILQNTWWSPSWSMLKKEKKIVSFLSYK